MVVVWTIATKAFGWLVGSPVGRWTLAILTAAVMLFAYGRWERSNGYQTCKTEWVAAEKAAVDRGASARRGAEQSATDGVRDPRDSDNN